MGESRSFGIGRDGRWGHGFAQVEDKSDRWWRNTRAHVWLRRSHEDRDEDGGWLVHVGGEWVHGSRGGLYLKVSTSGEETIDVHYGLGPLVRHYWSMDVERPGPRVDKHGRSFRSRRLVRLPGMRFTVELGLTGLRWCFGSDDHSWHRDAPLAERLRRNDLKWLRLGWHRRDNEEVESVEASVTLPEGSYPVRVTLERSRWGVRVGPLWMLRGKRQAWKRGPAFYLPVLRRQEWYAKVDVLAKGGLPFPGKGENSWDCGQDGLYGCAAAVARPSDSHDREWVAAGVAKATASVLRSRVRYGSGMADVGA